METAKETLGSGEVPRRVIKRYSNRKLYDTKDSRYVTLQQIGEMVRAGEEVQIIDNATKEDKTEVTLALIISEDLKSQPRSVPLGTLRDLIQERGERLLSQLREGPIGRLIPGATGEGGQAVPGAAQPAAPEAPATASPSQPPGAADVDRSSHAKGRLSGIVESSKQTLDQWQQAVDERVLSILPGLGLVRDLQSDVKRLSQRIDELEARLQGVSGGQGEPAAPPNGSSAADEPAGPGESGGSRLE
ncbi:transcriptional regulator [Sorangium cellulosum]|uniref:Transcriptional regulator n=1 Tax=Sorangium cellulosum TaxID=56 RepID=A0A2L0F721_SORCE|nr:polyhydroxyalkanoate synthesis regulator DNA-binding domain-containing protein [Sorangium cellulosum]AUX47378.1 transcriptional regulator [Sorangium cellulosum]